MSFVQIFSKNLCAWNHSPRTNPCDKLRFNSLKKGISSKCKESTIREKMNMEAE